MENENFEPTPGTDPDLAAAPRTEIDPTPAPKPKSKGLLLLLLVLLAGGGVGYAMFGMGGDDLPAKPAVPYVAPDVAAPAPLSTDDGLAVVELDAPPQPEAVNNNATAATPATPDATMDALGLADTSTPSEPAPPADVLDVPATPVAETENTDAVLDADMSDIFPEPTPEPAAEPAQEPTSETMPETEGTAAAPQMPDITEDTILLDAESPLSETTATPAETAPEPMPEIPAADPVPEMPMTEAAPEVPTVDIAGTTAAETAILQNMGAIDNVAAPAEPDASAVADYAAQPIAPAPTNTVEAAPIRDMPDKYFIIEKNAEISDSSARIAAGQRALNTGRVSSAVTMFDELYQDAPTNTRVLAARAVSLQRAGRVQDAIAAYEELLKQEPNNLNALTSLLGLLRTQNPNLALDQLLRLRQAYPSHAGVAAQLGIVYGDMGKLEDAARYLGVANSLEPNDATFRFNLAVVMDKLGNTIEAESLYRQALSLDKRYNADQPKIPRDAVESRLIALR